MKEKIKAARQAIDDLFGDTSVSPAETLAALQELRDEIDMRIGAIETDLRRNES